MFFTRAAVSSLLLLLVRPVGGVRDLPDVETGSASEPTSRLPAAGFLQDAAGHRGSESQAPKADSDDPPPGGDADDAGELQGLRHELAEAREELASFRRQKAEDTRQFDEDFEQRAGKRLLFWKKEQVSAFFKQNSQAGIGQRMQEEHIDGTKLFDILLGENPSEAARCGLANESMVEATKRDLWNYLATQDAPKEGLSESQKSAKDKCSFCDSFEVDYTFGYEWVLVPVSAPWPNPIHTFSCNPTVWKEFDISRAQVFGRNGTDALFNKVAKEVGNWIVDLVGTMAANIVNALETLARCAICGLCILWQQFLSGLEEVGKKIENAKNYLLATASKEHKNAAWDRFSEGFKNSLLEVFKMHEDGGAAAEVWRRRAREERERGRLYTDEEIEERLAHAERQHEAAVEAVTAARDASYERAGMQVRTVWKPKLERMASFAQSRGRAVAARAADTSFLEVKRSVLGAASLAEVESAPKGLQLPDECVDVLDPKNNLKSFREAFQFALNVEEPKIGDAWAKVMTLDFRGAAEDLIPEVLVMLVPAKRELGICLEAPEKLREAEACSCTTRHKGMCVMSMKYRVLSNMIRQEWPPMSPTWRQRMKVSQAIDESVLSSCLAEDQVLGALRSKAKRYSASIVGSLSPDEEQANLDYQDCRHIYKRVQDWDKGEDGGPKYGPLMWFAAMQVWAKEANKGEHGSPDVRMNSGSSEPDIEPFVHQFCDAVLDCEEATKEDGVFQWRSFVESFGKKSESQGDKKESATAKTGSSKADDRLLMHRHWAEKARESDETSYPEEVVETMRRLQEAYIDKVKPMMTKMLDLSTDFLSPPSPFKPQRAKMYSDGIYPPYSRLENPEALTTTEWVKLKSHVMSAKDVYVWLQVREEAGYAELRSLPTCMSECKKCEIESTSDEITPESLMNRAKHVKSCKRSKVLFVTYKSSSNAMKKCMACLAQEVQVAQIVDCNRIAANELYSLHHPLQEKGGNKYAVLHTFWPNLATNAVIGDEFQRTFIEFKDKSEFQKRVLHSELFSTVREAGKCFCLCEKIRDFTQQSQCHDVVRPSQRYLDGLEGGGWCVPDDSELPSAVCCTTDMPKLHALVADDLEDARSQMVCIRGRSFEHSRKKCLRYGMKLCTGTDASRLLVALKKPAISRPLLVQIKELEAQNFTGFHKSDAKDIMRFKTCLDMAGVAGAAPAYSPHSSFPTPSGLSRSNRWVDRIWVSDSQPKMANMEKALRNGIFAYTLQDCTASAPAR